MTALMAVRATLRIPEATAPAWTPADLGAALVAWYDAGDGPSLVTGAASGQISQWKDRSGNARHANQSTSAKQPHTDKRSGWVTFPLNETHCLELPLSGAQIDMGSTSRCVASVTRVFSGENNNQVLVGPYGNNAFAFFLRSGTNNNCGIAASNTAFFAIGSAVSADADHVFLANLTSSTWRVSLDGTASTGTHSRTLATGGISGFIGVERIGTFLNEFDWLYGDVGEIVICSELSEANQQKLEGYLAHRWGLSANLPGDHPYKSAAP